MKNFLEATNLKRATLIYLASKLPEKHLEDLRLAFIQIDRNGDGKIEAKEFS
jgi:Ca2+-binding EF-hand superfamily protein